jgi:hypothetical protein
MVEAFFGATIYHGERGNNPRICEGKFLAFTYDPRTKTMYQAGNTQGRKATMSFQLDWVEMVLAGKASLGYSFCE